MQGCHPDQSFAPGNVHTVPGPSCGDVRALRKPGTPIVRRAERRSCQRGSHYSYCHTVLSLHGHQGTRRMSFRMRTSLIYLRRAAFHPTRPAAASDDPAERLRLAA
jgi:hypothetical protein